MEKKTGAVLQTYVLRKEYDYTVTEDATTDITVIADCTYEELEAAIEEVNLRINYSDNEDYDFMTDYEILEKVMEEQGCTLHDVKGHMLPETQISNAKILRLNP